jgi:hypothetical protein
MAQADGDPAPFGAIGYYWVPPTWAAKAGCVMKCEALGTDYADAKRRCDQILNPQFDTWRTRGQEPSAEVPESGSNEGVNGFRREAPEWIL